MSVKGRSLQLFFIDGRPDGMLTAEVFNWTGHVLRVPRTQLKDALTREQAAFTGAYVLLGERDGDALAYIGEAEDLGERMRDHAKKKDWWETAVLITSAANNLHKAHVKYLESRLVEIADGVKATALDNGNIPPRSSLSEADQANMESFLDTLRMVLPAIRVDIFMDKSRPVSETAKVTENTLPVFELETPRFGIKATAVLKEGEWIVQAGSLARGDWVGDRAHNTNYHKLHDELCENGVLEYDGQHRRFTRDYAFSSPSAAGAVVNGRSTNGRTAWKLQNDGRTYAQWEDDQLTKVSEA
jgi:hypothetical protein